jgi:hypothetical protein
MKACAIAIQATSGRAPGFSLKLVKRCADDTKKSLDVPVQGAPYDADARHHRLRPAAKGWPTEQPLGKYVPAFSGAKIDMHSPGRCGAGAFFVGPCRAAGGRGSLYFHHGLCGCRRIKRAMGGPSWQVLGDYPVSQSTGRVRT